MRDRSQRLTVAAAAVIGLLTGSAFWLSYAHLHSVAAKHGLGGSEARAWAWPGCLDLFIVAGELLMLRASLARRTDWWAIALTAVGSGGSIALNIAGVGTHAQPLDYVVAAVPPTAALLAFGALMRQVHDALSDGTGRTDATPGAPHPVASDAASGHPEGQPLPSEQRLPEVGSAGRMEPALGPIPWPGLDGASVHPALHPAASGAGQSSLDHSTGAREVITSDVGSTDSTPGPDAPDAPDALPDADAPEAALIATARAVDQAARAETGRAASLRRLQAELRIGQPRAQQLQRILANA